MSILRFLVLLASTLQLGIGGYAAYRLLYLEVPDLVGLVICSTIIIAGLASISGLYVRPKPSLSRRSVERSCRTCTPPASPTCSGSPISS